jgi:hypothetical protein
MAGDRRRERTVITLSNRWVVRGGLALAAVAIVLVVLHGGGSGGGTGTGY